MPLPIKLLMLAAAKVARDERAQRAAKSLWDKGVDAWGKRQGRQANGNRQQRLPDGQAGDLIRFAYTDEHGLTCQRMVGHWQTAGGQLSGYCLNRKQEESFIVARIGEWEEFPVQARP